MAIYRPISISFWMDQFVLKLTPEQKYFYLYLMTNSKTKQCGIYELPKNIICFETGYNLETVNKLLSVFIDAKKIIYDDTNEEIFMRNWIKFNQINDKNIFKCVINELREVKSKTLIAEFSKCLNFMNVNQEFNTSIKEAIKGLSRGYAGSIKEETPTPTPKEKQSPILDTDFQKFWKMYEKTSGSKIKVAKKFLSLTTEIKNKIFATLPDYVKSTPKKEYRKNPLTYLNNEGWEDEIIFPSNNQPAEVNPGWKKAVDHK